MKILQLEYFDAICRNNSITKAAAELFVSQPAISKSLIELENEYEIKFFQRENNKLELTKEGTFFWESIKPILRSVKILKEELKIISKEKKSLNIGIPPMIGNFLLPDIFSKIYSNRSSMELNVFEHGSVKTMQLLDENEIDLGFMIREAEELKEDSKKYNYLKLADTELLFCVGKCHSFSEKKIIDLSELKDTPLILMKEGSFQNSKIEESFKGIGIEPNITLYSNQINTVKSLLKSGQVGAFFIREFIEKDKDIVGIELKQKINVDLILIWKKKSMLSSEIKKFIKMAKLEDMNKKRENSQGSKI